jgi:Type II intron maturase
MDPKLRKLFYVRYVDDYIIGVTGTHKETKLILSKVCHFLSEELKLDLSFQKASIVNFKKKTGHFLGTYINGISRVGMHVSVRKLLARLYTNKFLKRNKFGIYKPTALRKMVNLDHADVLGYYNSVWRRLLYYYFLRLCA